MIEFTTEHIVQFQILGAVLLSLFLGGLIGLEREIVGKPAGLRTHMLVAGATTLIVDLGDVAINLFTVETASTLVSADPLRIIEAVVAGISFLGAGTILRRGQRSQVEGLTTAASILFTAAVGISVALSQFVVAVGATMIALFILRLIQISENYFDRYPGSKGEQELE
ncbi:MAG: MgtC/SapB family protein [Candidatus Promineifilaceae bacterium]|nr:MgtC/SapB family protein [Candidatus Promineifilaceae bacterium]